MTEQMAEAIAVLRRLDEEAQEQAIAAIFAASRYAASDAD